MKRLFASVGLAAISASALHAQSAPGGSSQDNAKDWSLSASLRGFYDDNYLTLPKALARSSYGTEVSPSASINHTTGNTTYNVSYTYDLKYYLQSSITDSSHQFNSRLGHDFSDSIHMTVAETLVVAQDPAVIDTAILSSPLRSPGNNVHNTASLSFTEDITKKFSIDESYANNLYAYQQTYGDVYNPIATNAASGGKFNAANPSRSALLDRIEQLATVDLKYRVMPSTAAVLGYEYGRMGYTSPEGIIFGPNATANSANPTILVRSESRNNISHFLFVGADQDFNTQLHASIRVGGQYLDYVNVHQNTTGVYVDANMTWQYQQQSTAQLGVKHQHSATDVVGLATLNGEAVLDAEVTSAYANISHHLAGALTGTVLGQFQHSAFNGGDEDGKSENFFILNLNLAYRFSQYLQAEAGYNWNKLVSDIIVRDYTRNTIYMGIRATY